MAKKINILGALAAGAFAIAGAVISEVNQQKAIEEAVKKEVNKQDESNEEES